MFYLNVYINILLYLCIWTWGRMCSLHEYITITGCDTVCPSVCWIFSFPSVSPFISLCHFLFVCLLVCICHSYSVVWWLRLWFLSAQHSSKYLNKTQCTPRSLGPRQSIREKTTQRSVCFCSIKQPSEQQQPFSVWDVELKLSWFSLSVFFCSSLSNAKSKNCHESCSEICDGTTSSVFLKEPWWMKRWIFNNS